MNRKANSTTPWTIYCGTKAKCARQATAPLSWPICSTRSTVIPLGGFVRLAGESNPTVPLSLASRPPWQRIVVMAAGAAMNALLPLLIFTIMFMLPQDVEVGRLAITGVAQGSGAAEAGILPGDVFLEANGKPLERRLDFIREVNLNGGSEMKLLVQRDERREMVNLRPRFDADASRWLAGVTVELADKRVESRSRSIWEAVPESFIATWELLILLKQSISGMISEGAAPELAGPVGIARMTGEVSRDGGLAGMAQRRHPAEHQSCHHQHTALPDAGRRAHRVRDNRVGAAREADSAGKGGPGPPHRPGRPHRRHPCHNRQRHHAADRSGGVAAETGADATSAPAVVCAVVCSSDSAAP